MLARKKWTDDFNTDTFSFFLLSKVQLCEAYEVGWDLVFSTKQHQTQSRSQNDAPIYDITRKMSKFIIQIILCIKYGSCGGDLSGIVGSKEHRVSALFTGDTFDMSKLVAAFLKS